MTIFQGSALDIYIHWLITALGACVLLFGLAVLASCRSVAKSLGFLREGGRGGRAYRTFQRYHSAYWITFASVLAMHLMVTVSHVGLPEDPYLFAHRLVFFTALANLILVLVVFSSCRTIVGVLNLISSANPLANVRYRRFYGVHALPWWLLGASVALHVISGLVHALNT